MAVKYSNNASSTLSANITDSATSFDVADASSFPTLDTNDHMYLSIVSASGIEIIRVTDITGNTITCTRGEDSSTAYSALLGDSIELRITTGMLQDIDSDARDFATVMAVIL